MSLVTDSAVRLIVHRELTQFAWLRPITAHSVQMKMGSVKARSDEAMLDL